MRKEFEGVGKGGITEVRVNAMSARGGREGNPVCYFSSRVLIPYPSYFENSPCENGNAMDARG